MIDFHPWPSRRADTEHPDELRIDIDPQPGTDFADGKAVAAIVRETLAEIGYTGWPKTSGNRGIHIACRIEPQWEFPVVRRAALAFAREIERRAPELVTTAWWKEERGEKVFIDYNQNARDRTIASAYSVRARPDAAVSAPVTWDELPDVETEDFTLVSMPPRFAKLGDVQAAIDDTVCDLRGAARVGRARRGRRRRRGAVPAELPEDAGRAGARAAVAGEEEGVGDRRLSRPQPAQPGVGQRPADPATVGPPSSRGGRSSAHVHERGILVRPEAQQLRAVPEARALHLVVAHLGDELGPQRLLLEPAAAPAVRLREAPVGRLVEQRQHLLGDRVVLARRDRGRADVVDLAVVVVEPEQQRRDLRRASTSSARRRRRSRPSARASP